MNQQWYYARDGVQHGPVERAELLRLRAEGTLDGESLVWCADLGSWAALAQVPPHLLQPAAPPPIPPDAATASPAVGAVGAVDRPERELAFEFRGSAPEYFRIWIVNVVLTVLTLGIYAAWAKVRTRRYFYGNTLLDGKPFEFTGSPVGILKGNLIFGGLFVGYNVLAQLYPLYAGLGLLVMAAVVPWLVWKALRFRAHNTRHRNVRLGFHGSLGEAYRVYLLMGLLIPLTLGLIAPYLGFLRKRYLFGNLSWGSSRTAMRGEAGFFYLTFFKAVGIQMLFWILATVTLVAGAVWGSFKLGIKEPPPALIGVAVLVFYLPVFLIFLYYQVRTGNHVINTTEWAGVGRLRSSLRVRDLAWMYFSNACAVLCSLGLLIPWARVRMARYTAARTMLIVSGDLDQVAQTAGQEESALGDTGADVFDVEIGF